MPLAKSKGLETLEARDDVFKTSRFELEIFALFICLLDLCLKDFQSKIQVLNLCNF